MNACPLQMTQQEYDDIAKCEAVVIREYEGADGEHFARPVAWGDESEMRDQAETPGLFLVPVGVRIVAQKCLKVSELIGATA